MKDKDAPKHLDADLVTIPKEDVSIQVVGSQPVADLESYMTSMEKKQESIEKMMQKLEPSSDPAAKKLHDALQPVLNELKDSYNTFSTYITELKMEHKDGKVASAELSALLNKVADEKNVVRKSCAAFLPLDARFRGLVKDLKLDDNKNVKSKNKGGKNKGNGDASRRGKGSKSKSKGSSGSKVDKPKERKSKGAPSKKKKVPRTPATDESAPAADQPSPAKKSRKSKAKA